VVASLSSRKIMHLNSLAQKHQQLRKALLSGRGRAESSRRG
jgi:hypothetical protein